MSPAHNGHLTDFSQKTRIMGVLNVTPDSFSDGGLYFDRARALDHALRLAEEGADIIDIGGESTRPGSEPVSLDEEIRRTIPVIETLSGQISTPLSIDTCKSEVARRALDAGAFLVNDVSGLRFDPEMAGLIAEKGVSVVIMHMRGTPKDMQKDPVYEDLISEIMEYLHESIHIAEKAGVDGGKIIVDPGIGFGKTVGHNLRILKDLKRFRELNRPILIGTSRKSFIGNILGNISPEERIMGTAATVAIGIINGADIVRVHDVREMVDVVKIADAIKRA